MLFNDFFAPENLPLHSTESQMKKQAKIKELSLKDVDKKESRAYLDGGNPVTLEGCFCDEFKNDGLPCSHMYKLAQAVGVFKKKSLDDRSLDLIADFSGEYAKGWTFAVPQAFAEALDIKWTPRAVGDAESQSSSNGRKKRKMVKVLTQGENYEFNDYVILYDNKAAYEIVWKDALNNFNICLKVISSTPSTIASKVVVLDNIITNIDYIIYGDIKFDIYKPSTNGVVKVNTSFCKKNEFVNLLRYGKFVDSKDISKHYLELLEK